jgi:AcrR family transcriptional regulator
MAKGTGASVPKQVDHEQRRRQLAEAVFEVIGSRGYEAVSLRDVATAAGVSMGAVQHYFDTKHDMLLFALQHLRARVLARMSGELGRLSAPSRRELIRTGMRAMLPVDEPSRQEAALNIAFFSAATVDPEYARLLHEGYSRLLQASRAQLRDAEAAGELADGLDVDAEAASLFIAVQGFIGPILIGVFTPDEALALLDRSLDRIFATPSSAPAREAP